MTTRVWSALLATVIVAAGMSIGIVHEAHATAARRLAHHHPLPAVEPTNPTKPTTVPADATFADARSGITVCYPAAWRLAPAKTAELAVAAPTGSATLQLDVPAMGWHSPIIPIGLVASGYLDALRKSALPDAAVQETADLTVAGATARRLTARGHPAAGCLCNDTAVVIVHRGQVYILSCDSDDANVPVARAALDAAVASVRWSR